MGDVEATYRSTPSDMDRVDLDRLKRGTMSLRALLEACAEDPTGPELYVPGLNIPPGTPLGREMGKPAVLEEADVFGTSIFLGRNTKCIGHYHPKTQAMLCQVQGKKRIWMYPPSELPKVHLFPFWSEGFFRSEVNWYGDRKRFPRAAEAKGTLYELEPGDALFIPLHWLHVPEGEGWNVSVTYWWRPTIAEWPIGLSTVRTLAGIGVEAIRQRRSGVVGRFE